jgi:hypothetical protein
LKDKLGIAVFCLLFAVIFGGGGAFAAWMMGTMIYDGVRAQDWIKVRASVDSPGSYRYAFQGREFHGTRLGLERLGSSDDIDDWREAMDEHLASAIAEARPIMVFVNPARPEEAVVDREIRWKLLLFLSPFVLVFGGVGAGALWFLGRTLAGKPVLSRAKAKAHASARSDQGARGS